MTGTEEDRWAEAESILRGEASPATTGRLRRQNRSIWLVILGCAVVGAVVGGLVAGFAAHGPHHHGGRPWTWRDTVGATLSVLGIVVSCGAAVSTFRKRRWAVAWHSPIRVLTRRQRKELLAQVRGRTPADPARLPLARYLAAQLVRQRTVVVLNGGVVLLWVGQAVLFPDALHLALYGAASALFLVAVPLSLREGRRAERFLAAHPGRTDSGG